MEEILQEEAFTEQSHENQVLLQLNEALQQEEQRRKKYKKTMIILSLVALLGTPLVTYGSIRLANRHHSQSMKQNVIQKMQPVAKTESYTTKQIVDMVSDSVVEIQITTKDRYGDAIPRSAGSGVIISEDGYIATNHHVIKGDSEDKILVILKDGKQYEAKIVGNDAKTDLAVLKIDVDGLTKATLTDSDQVVVGEKAVAIGNSLGFLGGTVTQGIVSAVNRESSVGTYKLSLIQTDAPVNQGNSGGGLFNESGQLIGIVTQKASGNAVEGLGFAIPSNVVHEITKELIEHGYVKSRASIGIQIREIQSNNPITKSGVYVFSSTNEALKKYDLITQIDGKKITSGEDVLDAIRLKKVGDVIEVVIERNHEEQTVQVTLQEARK